MKTNLKKRGQKIARKFSRASIKASEESREHIRENLIQRISHIQSIRLLIFEWVLLVAALTLLAVAQAIWFADSYAVDTFVDGGGYIEATIGKVNSMNPLFATTSSEKTLSKLMFATLSTNDYSGNPGLGLASAITPSEDGKIWTLRLRDGLFWSDGEPITNDDVMFTIELIQSPATNSIYDTNLENVKVTEKENGEIVFTLPSQYADFISALNFPIVPKHELDDASIKNVVEDDFSTNPVTSGPFAFNAVQNTGDAEKIVYLSANQNYYLGRPMLDSFAVHTYDTKDEVLAALNTGTVTATAELSGADVSKITSQNLNIKDSSINAGTFMFFNLSNQYLAKSDLRKAIRQGINLVEVRSVAGDVQPLNYPILESQIQLASYPAIPEYDFESAKAKISEIAGGGEIELNVATVNSGYLPEVAKMVADNLTALGIKANVIPYAENQDFVTNVVSKRNYDILVYEVELGADPDPLPYYHSSQTTASGLNLSKYRNSLVDDLLVGARETLNDELRKKKYEAFLEHWVADVPAIGLYQSNLTYVYNKNVRPFGNDVRLVTAIDRFSDISTWASTKGSRSKTP